MSDNLQQRSYDFNQFIGIFNNFYSKKECDEIIKLFNYYEKSGLTMTRQQEYPMLSHSLKDDSAILLNNIVELDEVQEFIPEFKDRFFSNAYSFYVKKYHSLSQYTLHDIKYIKIQKTDPCQGYHTWHYEHGSDPYNVNRVLAYMLYLNDVEDGGETEFLFQSFRIKPKVGTLLIWPAAFTHMHRGNPPLNETKYILTGWVEFLYDKSIPNFITNPPNNEQYFKNLEIVKKERKLNPFKFYRD